MYRRFLPLIVIALFLTPTFSFAELPTRADIPGSGFTLSVSDPSPAPSQSVAVTAESSSIDLNRAKISWSVNGKVVATGTGNKSQGVKVGSFGQTTTVTVTVSLGDNTYTERIILTPSASVDLIWQASSYVPPFYKGKALLSYQGVVTIEAVPNFVVGGQRINPKNLVYTWSNNGDVLGSASGYGKNSLTIMSKGINLEPLAISVKVSNATGNLQGEGETTIRMQSPQGLFYEDNPAYGILYNRALATSFRLDKKEMTLHLAPYYFSNSTPHSVNPVEFKWSINGSRRASEQNIANTLVVRTPDNTAGSSRVGVQMTTPSKLLQYASANILINFGEE